MRYLVDIGSSTVKVYVQKCDGVALVQTKTFDFKEGFEANAGLSTINREGLFDYFNVLIKQYSLTRKNTKLYATGLFREIINKQVFIEEFYTRTHMFFNIVPQDLEAFYLEKAWVGKHTVKDALLVINIGGKSTELIFYSNNTVARRTMLPIGVGTVLKKYPWINEVYSTVSLDEVIKLIKKELPEIESKFDTAIYTGGELTYMQLAGYILQKNTIFCDTKHPSIIDLSDYCDRNEQVFSEVSFEELRAMMPTNPNWMNGASIMSP